MEDYSIDMGDDSIDMGYLVTLTQGTHLQKIFLTRRATCFVTPPWFFKLNGIL